MDGGKSIMQNGEKLNEWIFKNSWQFILALVSIAITYGVLITRVSAIEKRNEKVDPLVDRFIQLEERDKQLFLDISEIKADIKDIKKELSNK